MWGPAVIQEPGVKKKKSIFTKPTYIFTTRVYIEREPEGPIHPNVNHSWFWVVRFFMMDFPSFCLSVFFPEVYALIMFPYLKQEEKRNPVPVKI